MFQYIDENQNFDENKKTFDATITMKIIIQIYLHTNLYNDLLMYCS